MSPDTTWFPNQEMDQCMENRGQYRVLKQVTGKVYTHIRQEQIKCVCSWQGDGRRHRRRYIQRGKKFIPLFDVHIWVIPDIY
jgi:hypothetical protein